MCGQQINTSGESVHSDIFRKVCTCKLSLEDDILVNYRHAEGHNLNLDKCLFILVGFFANNKHRSKPKSQ